MHATSKPGPESKVTVELVHRVSERVAKGIPIRVALQSEPVTYDAYKKHLQRHPELRAIHAAAKIKFLDVTLEMICKKPGPMLRWLLERRHSDVFGANAGNTSDDLDLELDPDPVSVPKNQNQTIAGVPQEDLEAARLYAQTL